MYRYEYETVSCEFDGWGAFAGNSYGIGNYREIIDARARDGWRYVVSSPPASVEPDICRNWI